MDVLACFVFLFVFFFLMIRAPIKGACRRWQRHIAAHCAFTGFFFFRFTLQTAGLTTGSFVFTHAGVYLPNNQTAFCALS